MNIDRHLTFVIVVLLLLSILEVATFYYWKSNIEAKIQLIEYRIELDELSDPYIFNR